MSKSMDIKEAATQLRAGKVVNSANARATIKAKKVEGQDRVTVTRGEGESADVMDMTLSRMMQLYSKHTFGMGKYSIPSETKPASPEVTK